MKRGYLGEMIWNIFYGSACAIAGIAFGWNIWGRTETNPTLHLHNAPAIVTMGKEYNFSVSGGTGPVSVSGLPGSDLPDAVDVSVHGTAINLGGDYAGEATVSFHRGESTVNLRVAVVL